MARKGMNSVDVNKLGEDLEKFAATIEAELGRLDKRVAAVEWDGDDAKAFKTDWWPKHKKALLAAKGEIQGLGRSAKNNAKQQDDTSSR